MLKETEVYLPAGTRLRVSTVHSVGPADPGDGVICANDGQEYNLIVDCPRRISALGLLVRKDALSSIPEKEYVKKSLFL